MDANRTPNASERNENLGESCVYESILSTSERNYAKIPAISGNAIKSSRNTALLRAGVIFLAVVSFFTTANGMRSYIFKQEGDGAVAYAASAAIQSILLALSMNLPRYLSGIWNSDSKNVEPPGKGESETAIQETYRQKGKSRVPQVVLCALIILLTLVTISCSSWFSYVYIADVIHQDSWDMDSELLVQQAYRTELYDARDYAHSYRTYLEDSLGEDILLLEQQAAEIGDSIPSIDVKWERERETYISGGGTAASYMSPVILAMETAMQDGLQEDLDYAAAAVADAEENISGRIATVQENLDRINTNLANYNAQIANLTARINNATEETDITLLNASISNLTELINDITRQQIDLQQESTQLDNALLRLPYYESLLGLNNSSSSVSIRSRLIQMQSEFFKQNPDDKLLIDVAMDIFDDLRNAAGAVTSGADGAASDAFSYTSLLVQMNRLSQNLADYSDIKEIEANLDELITALRTTLGDEPEPGESEPESNPSEPESDQGEPEPDPSEPEPDQGEPELGQGETEPDQGEPEPDQNEPDSLGAEPPERQDAANTQAGSSTWQDIWRARLDALKAQISAMPIYSESEETETGTVKALTDSQASILRSYDRNASSAVLDEMIRRYISDHNAIYQGIIYLASPYRMLAIFALCLALSFDLSGFVFGVIMQGEPQQERRESEQETGAFPHAASGTGRRKSMAGKAEWSILDHFQQYKVLTGDFTCRDGKYYYKVFRDGLAEYWEVNGKDGEAPYKQGIYMLGEDESSAEQVGGELVDSADDMRQGPYTRQDLLYSGQKDGPKDGVYVNCRLVYKEGGLSKREADGTLSFICSLEEYVPVHCYNPAEKENRTFPINQLDEKKELAAKIAVIALNKSGTRVSAIYMIRDR